MRRLLKMGLLLVSSSLMLACAAVVKPGPGIMVTITNAFASAQAGTAPVTLKVDVANDPSNRGVRWALTLGNTGCSPSCGTLEPEPAPSFKATYTPPASAPLNQTATISAVAVADNRQSFVFNFMITPGISVKITNKFVTQTAGGSAVVVNASVPNDSANAGLTWTLTAGGANCSPACGTLTAGASPSFSASYTPPAAVPTGANASPTITATSVTDTTKSDSFSFTIASALGLFKGSYTFLLRGYDITGSPMAMAGSVTADGSGKITAGEVDIDNGGGITYVPSPATGNYSIDPSFHGVTRGTINITSFTFPNSTVNIALKFALSADGKRGTAVEFDGAGFRNSGTILLQDPTALSAANAAGTYAFGLDSDAPVGGRTVEAGQFILGASGITGGVVDLAKDGDATPKYSAAPITAGPATKPDSSGRGTFTLTVMGDPIQYAYYVVDATQLNLIQIDRGLKLGTVQAGVARAQKTLTASSVNATSVLQMTGIDAVPGTNKIGPNVLIGVMKITAGSTFNLTFDSNDVGTVLTTHPASGLVSSFNPATGRGVLTSPGGFNNGFLDSAVFYLYDTGSGFIIDTDPSAPNGTPPPLAITNNALSGTLTQQAPGPFTNQSLSGNLLVRSGASSIPDIPNLAGAINVDNVAATFTGIGDLASIPSQVDDVPNVTFSGTYNMVDQTSGHASGTLPAGFEGNFTQGLTYPVSFYMIAPNQFVLISRQSGAFSGITFFDPQ
ncbi:MAG TPA: hypothetical protein VN982_10105 [Candidatus Dormibacteraeota bacterium]|nr:hypothetical protein [Candidatus Dormibacteraeota bacterium]